MTSEPTGPSPAPGRTPRPASTADRVPSSGQCRLILSTTCVIRLSYVILSQTTPLKQRSPTMATVERPALIEVQRGQIMISTTLTPAQLERYAKVDAYDPERGTDPGNG